MTAGVRWALAIVGLLAGNAIAMAALLVSANTGGAQVIPAYYDRAAHYDDELDEAARSRALGWRAAVAAEAGAIRVDVTDAAGAPLAGARVRVTGHHRAHAARQLDLEAAAVAPGRYRAPAPARAGRHDLVIEVVRGGDRFVARAVVDVP